MKCTKCGQQNTDWATHCGRCETPLLQPYAPIDLDDVFEEFMRKVNPAVQQHEAQYKESRRVWFAACAALFHHMAFSVPTVSDADGIKEFMSINRQLLAFKKRVAEHKD